MQAWAEDRKDPTIDRILVRGGDVARVLRAAHEAHVRSIDAVERDLRRAGVEFRLASSPPDGTGDRWRPDLVVSVGGDGTFLEAARLARTTPILGINSDPARSTGRFCATARQGFARLLRGWLAGELRPVRLARLRATAARAGTTADALNDLLVAHLSPASTTSYVLALGDRSPERQRSSGIWMATAAGSTGAARSAGGRVMPLRSRRLQFVVREPFRGARGRARLRLVRGFVQPGEELRLECRQREMMVWFDGGRVRWPLELGDVLRVGLSPVPCNVLGIR